MCALIAIDHGLQGLDARPPFPVSLHDGPGGGIRVGLLEHLFQGFDVGIPLFAVAPILFRQLPVLPGIFLPLLETVELLLLGNVNPEFDQHQPVVRQRFLKFVDFAVGALPFLLLGEFLHSLHEHTPVPSAIEDADAPSWGQAQPESPQPMGGFLRRARRADRMHLVPAGVEGFGTRLMFPPFPVASQPS